ncbi:MAG: PhzF family phenazine biosynthesis protein [Gemmatimonadetes bacterium]|nr:PhzF family phenazine biosynthesis protein [Gemmatimonadota bacterium]
MSRGPNVTGDPLPVFVVDAFARHAFEGNPAAVCVMNREASTEWMQRVADELNLSETVFVVPRSDGCALRWFTPTAEASLCGHATLAAAHVLWETGRADVGHRLSFHTRSGVLAARRLGGDIEIDLPARPVRPAAPTPGVARALGLAATHACQTLEQQACDRDLLIELEGESAVRELVPDFTALRDYPGGIIATARSASGQYDFVSRYFAPAWGIDEDPVTGSAHCALAPYWRDRLGRERLVGYQASVRGGVVLAEVRGERVRLAGGAVTVSRGSLVV